MRVELSETPIARATKCPVTVISNSHRILSVRIDQHAGTVRDHNSECASASLPSPSGPAPDHLIHRLWKKSPYCKDSPKHGVIVRINGRWVNKKRRGF